jgi:hypothetical protein
LRHNHPSLRRETGRSNRRREQAVKLGDGRALAVAQAVRAFSRFDQLPKLGSLTGRTPRPLAEPCRFACV